MKLKRITALLCVLCLAVSLIVPAGAASSPATSDNINENYYVTWAETVKSHLYSNSLGGVTRVEYLDGTIVVEDYDSSFALVSSREIPMELSIWGGFFHGESGNYFVFGQTNHAEDDGAEVIRVVKYSHDWQRLGSDSLYGANTTVPFDAGSLRFDEYGGMLYVRTSHEMYRASDGYNHQANLTLSFDESSMKITDSYYIVMNSGVGYVSHSFNQFILIDSEANIITVDHGDAYPRSIVLMQYAAKAGGSTFTGSTSSVDLQVFPGAIGANTTGASVGGLAETSSGYVTAYSYDGQGGGGTRGIYLAYTAKGSLASRTSCIFSDASTTPQLVPTGLGGGYVLWNVDTYDMYYERLCYAQYSADGGIGEIKTAEIPAPLSDCQPIYHNGKVVWYVTNRGVPTFYLLDSSGVTSVQAGGGSTTPTPTPTPDPNPNPDPEMVVIYYYVDGELLITQTSPIGDTYTNDHLIKDGYEFLGWFTSETGGTRYGLGDLITETSPRVLYAQYRPIETEPEPEMAVIYYYVDGVLYNTQTVPIGQPYSRAYLVKDGYEFLGWFTAEVGGTRYGPTDIITETSPRVLYARYRLIETEPEPVSIHYYADGKLVMFYDASVGDYYTDYDIEKEGYEFLGWYSSETGGVRYGPTDIITETSPRVLYARFELIETEPENSIILQIGNPLIYINGSLFFIDSDNTAPVILHDRTLLPVRAVIEAMGGDVGWDAQARIVSLTLGGSTLYLQIDNNLSWDDRGGLYSLDSEPVIINDRTMLPIRFVVEYFGGAVEWDGETQTVTIRF